MITPKLILPVLLVGLLINVSCTEDEEVPEVRVKRVKEAIYASMNEWYFWNDFIPSSVNVDRYSSYEDLLRGLVYNELDRWSYITTPSEFNRAFTGQQAGHGFGIGIGTDDNLYISFVYDASPAGKDGWQRGWEVIEVNGRPISAYRSGNGYNLQLGPNTSDVQNTFVLRLPDGSETTRTIGKAEYQTNSVLHKEIVKLENKQVGYWVYNSFRASPGVTPTKSMEVEEALQFFEDGQIEELIIDLRYNGGGSVDVAEQIMNALIPGIHDGKLMYTNALNNDKSNFNETYEFKKTGNLELERLIFITSRGSASASELIINCLEPYIETVIIGEDTFGKPVGSFPLSRYNNTLSANDIELVPITFAIANANGKAEYFDGFPVDFPVGDDISKNWGDQKDPRLQAALSYIQFGSVGSQARLSYKDHGWAMIDEFSGLLKEFPSY
ncbi:S41 family peptidase [Lunatimonas salinarum]|uniref:S41 family peptidase n=1 Tax=Lunatimonas salinarum TaxID=1774590 RepID=UPI001AE08001|nr:S41 family peptidase [Lunatimonas salinarum]